MAEMMQDQMEILQKNPLSLFLKFSITSIISLLALSSASFIDAIFVGKACGEQSLAAVNLISPILSFISGLQMIFGSGGSVRVGKYLGEGRLEKAQSMFSKTILSVSAILVFFSIIFVGFAEEVTYFLGAKETQINALSSKYLRTLSPFFLTWGVVYTFSLFVRIDGKPKLATLGLLLTAVFNILGDYFLIVVFRWGIVGAALATGFSSVLPAALFLCYFLFVSKNMKLRRPGKRWHELILAGINGFSEFLSEISGGIVVFLFNRVMMNRFGTEGVAAFTAINYVLWFGQMTLYAISDSVTPLISVNFGAKRNDRIRSILKIARICGVIISAICFLLLTFFAEELIFLFFEDKSSKAFEIGCEFAGYIRYGFLFFGFNMINSAWMTAVHRPMESLLISGARALVFPVFFLVVLPKFFGLYGVYTAIPVAEATTLLISVVIIFYLRFDKKRRRAKLG